MVKMGAPRKAAKDVKQALNLRVKPALKAALKKAAADDSRTTAAFAEKLLADWLKEHGYLK